MPYHLQSSTVKTYITLTTEDGEESFINHVEVVNSTIMMSNNLNLYIYLGAFIFVDVDA